MGVQVWDPSWRWPIRWNECTRDVSQAWRSRQRPPYGCSAQRARARERAEQLAEEERKARWEADTPERLRRQQESDKRERQRHEEFLAAAEAKSWRYEDLGQCHLDKRKKRFATELDAKICPWVQREKHGGSLQRAYRCDGSDTPEGDGCGSWHLTSKSSFT